MASRSVKCVVVGDPEIGKTCLIVRYTSGDFSSFGNYVPTIADTFSINLTYGNTEVAVSISDTAGNIKSVVHFILHRTRGLWKAETASLSRNEHLPGLLCNR